VTLTTFIRFVAEDVRRQLLTPWAAAAVVTLAAVSFGALLSGQRDVERQRAEYEALLQERLESQMRAKQVLWGRAPEAALRAIRAPSPGVTLVIGRDRAIPAAWDFAPWGTETLFTYRHREWDFESLIRIPGGLVALLLGTILVVRDRTSGWIAALHAMPIAAWQVSIARLLGMSLSVAGAFTLWWTLIWLSGGHLLPAGITVWPLLPTAIVYGWTLGAVGLACAWLSRTPSRGLLVGLGFWTLASILMPSVIPRAVGALASTTERREEERLRREQYADDVRLTELEVSGPMASMLPVEVTDPGAVDRWAAANFPRVERQWRAGMQRAREAAHASLETAQHAAALHETYIRYTGWLVPGLLVKHALAEVAGTGSVAARRWEHAVAQRHAALRALLFDDRPTASVRLPAGGAIQGFVVPRRSPPRVAEAGIFEPPAIPFGSAAGFREFGPAMIAWLIVSFCAAFAAGASGSRRGA
jgi:hypothetical protein